MPQEFEFTVRPGKVNANAAALPCLERVSLLESSDENFDERPGELREMQNQHPPLKRVLNLNRVKMCLKCWHAGQNFPPECTRFSEKKKLSHGFPRNGVSKPGISTLLTHLRGCKTPEVIEKRFLGEECQ